MSSVTCRNGIAAGLLICGIALAGCAVRNPDVIRQIETEPDANRARHTLVLELPDGKQLPVNYLREGDRVYLGADGRWWRAFRTPAAVRLLLRGTWIAGEAVAVRDDRVLRRRVFRQLRPLFPTWLPQWLGGVLIVVQLPASAASPSPRARTMISGSPRCHNTVSVTPAMRQP